MYIFFELALRHETKNISEKIFQRGIYELNEALVNN